MAEEKSFSHANDLGKLGEDSTPHASPGNGEAHQAGSFSLMKPPLSVDKQIDHLVEQGIVVNDRAFARRCLLNANYYRLRGYWMTFEKDGVILEGTRLESIWDIHEFDRKLRLWLWRLIERIEIKARTQFAYTLSNEFGPSAHLDVDLFRDSKSHSKSIVSLNREISYAQSQKMPCVIHNLDKYGQLPLWAAVEVMSLGTVSSLYGNLREDIKAHGHDKSAADEIADAFGTTRPYLVSWLRHLTMVRNICAHHNRFYNRLLKTSPRMLKRDKAWSSKREFPTFVTLMRIYEISWPEEWKIELQELDQLIRSYSCVSLQPMGFPDKWRDVLGIQSTDANEAEPR